MMKLQEKKIAAGVIAFLVLLTMATHYYGSTDVGDYADSAKYFAGKYKADIRNSHSYMFGYLHSPFLMFSDSFFIFKITSLIFLISLVMSVYYIAKDKRAFWLMLVSPAVWYMAPWINPIQLASLITLWSFYFIQEYDKKGKLSHLVYSGILLGVGASIWNTLFFIGAIMWLIFCMNKKLSHAASFIVAMIAGLIPLLLLDYHLFNFPFYSILRTTMSNFIATLFGGIYGTASDNASKILRGVLILITIPIYFWKLFSKPYFKENKKTLIFLALSLFLLLLNSQLRYILVLIPIIVFTITKNLDEKKFKKQLYISIIISCIFIIPYILQISYAINQNVYGGDIQVINENIDNLQIHKDFPDEELLKNLKAIVAQFPNEIFIVGNAPDDYATTAHFYWGNEVKEFVSIQDYIMFRTNKTILFQKELSPQSTIADRREIYLVGGIRTNTHDLTDYAKINYAIGINEEVKLENFKFVEKYGSLYLSKKVNKE